METFYLPLPLSLLLATTTMGQSTEAEARLKAKVEEMGLNFSVSESGSYRFVFSLEKDRTQLVIINKKLARYLDTDYIYVYSPTLKYPSKEQIPRQLLLELMNKNGSYKLGWYELVSVQASSVILLSHKQPLSATAVNLYALMKEIAAETD